jgi:hypothetical protein
METERVRKESAARRSAGVFHGERKVQRADRRDLFMEKEKRGRKKKLAKISDSRMHANGEVTKRHFSDSLGAIPANHTAPWAQSEVRCAQYTVLEGVQYYL